MQATYTIKQPWTNPWFETDPYEPRMPKERVWNPNQLEIQYFFPLTEQIPLDLDFQPCIDYQKSKIPGGVYSSDGLTISSGTGLTFNSATWGSTNIAPQLSITPTNSVGTLSVGGLNIGLEEKPNILRRILFKLLGFKWK